MHERLQEYLDHKVNKMPLDRSKFFTEDYVFVGILALLSIADAIRELAEAVRARPADEHTHIHEAPTICKDGWEESLI